MISVRQRATAGRAYFNKDTKTSKADAVKRQCLLNMAQRRRYWNMIIVLGRVGALNFVRQISTNSSGWLERASCKAQEKRKTAAYSHTQGFALFEATQQMVLSNQPEGAKKLLPTYASAAAVRQRRNVVALYASGFLLTTGLVTDPLRMQRVQALMDTT